MKSTDFIKSFKIFSREGKVQPASSSEVSRWIKAGNIIVNGERLDFEEIDFPIFSLVIFPKGKRITLL